MRDQLFLKIQFLRIIAACPDQLQANEVPLRLAGLAVFMIESEQSSSGN
jgi:hypothetical protein